MHVEEFTSGRDKPFVPHLACPAIPTTAYLTIKKGVGLNPININLVVFIPHLAAFTPFVFIAM